MPQDLTQLLAASVMVLQLERIASSGMLPEDEEAKLRKLICRACRAFDIPSIAERPDPDLTAQIIEFAAVHPGAPA